jgi:predicted 3-demethylubiquinone-9 3-methyltransferase (glyoxalase superfamily)
MAKAQPAGTAMVAAFELEGQEFLALNGGPMFKFTEAVSFVVNCETQAEVDHYWEKLSAGGKTQQCGWLKDKFGLSWQIVPTALPRLMKDKDPEKRKRVLAAMMQMVKIDIAALQRAYDGN